ncbi:MAG: polysaccharide deacetylase family protein [Holophagales bacterium]|nr:MAG: polysaccharide deacetylase family protein [Holophagales bacterium]
MRQQALAGAGRYALSIDVEEWYHTCWVGEWVDPGQRPRLVEELDRLIPSTLDLLAECRARATFFVLGEVARRLPDRIRQVAGAGHEVASHGDLHFRVDRWSVEEFSQQASEAKRQLEDLTGAEVVGFRAPEWSMRRPDNPRLRALAEAGYRYDSSVSPCWGAGSHENLVDPYELSWSGTEPLLEMPPLAFGGAARLPVCGWTGRVVPPAWIARAARRRAAAGGAAVMTFHPWEIVDRPVPGEMMGLARLFHDLGRRGYRDRLAEVLARLPWMPLREAAGWSSPVIAEGGASDRSCVEGGGAE